MVACVHFDPHPDLKARFDPTSYLNSAPKVGVDLHVSWNGRAFRLRARQPMPADTAIERKNPESRHSDPEPCPSCLASASPEATPSAPVDVTGGHHHLPTREPNPCLDHNPGRPLQYNTGTGSYPLHASGANNASRLSRTRASKEHTSHRTKGRTSLALTLTLTSCPNC